MCIVGLFWVLHLNMSSMHAAFKHRSWCGVCRRNPTLSRKGIFYICHSYVSALAVLPLQLCAALHGWHGPELLPLAVALQQLQAAQQQQPHQRKSQPVVSQPVLRLLRSGLLPAVGRADEVAGSSCVRSGGYKAALRSLMRDEPLLQALPQDVARSLALTYWYQVGLQGAWLTVLAVGNHMTMAVPSVLALDGAICSAAPRTYLTVVAVHPRCSTAMGHGFEGLSLCSRCRVLCAGGDPSCASDCQRYAAEA
jgi:hypothetical protein